jgi:peptidoglycan/LPS O-acetylase OafA/YrhL
MQAAKIQAIGIADPDAAPDRTAKHGTSRTHFAGLDSLRFYAAFLVLIGHIHLNQESVGLPGPNYGAVFYRGAPAVSFFFTLSGFLITYLLLDEHRRTGAISIRAFYIRRVLRIWPLYFLIIGLGLTLYKVVLPRLGIYHAAEYSVWTATALYVLFLPNLMNNLYVVGGILNPTWSIGVEEQFYLFWAPVIKKFHRHVPRVCLLVMVLSLAAFALNQINPFGLGKLQGFFAQLKFHYMAAGGLCAWMLYKRRAQFLGLPIFRYRLIQWLFALLLLEYLFVGTPRHWLIEESLQVVLYSWLIVEVAANPRRLVRVKARATEWLGEISYGIYMYHMVAVYATSWYFKSTRWWEGSLVVYVATYYTMAAGLTLLLAYVSHRWFERPILRLKPRFSR